MKSLWLTKEQAYDGTQLRSLYAYLDHGVLGDSIVGWRGPCHVSFEHMVDGEDLRDQSAIAGSDMLHFIVEIFGASLAQAVAEQRLLASLALDELRARLSGDLSEKRLCRKGDDIYFENRKFSISIATNSPVSSLIHFAVNCRNAGTPVPTCALEEWDIDPTEWAQAVMLRYQQEHTSLIEATQKVRWVR